jgi:hypothetical protein
MRARCYISIVLLLGAMAPNVAWTQSAKVPANILSLTLRRDQSDSNPPPAAGAFTRSSRPDASTRHIRTSSSDSTGRSHAVRNGFWIGASIGTLAAAYAATYAESGCTGEPCHARAIENRGIAVSAIVGGVLGGVVGAGVGKLSHLH